MKKYLETFLAMQDETFLKTHIQALLRLELPQTYSANHRAMDYAEQLLQTLGFETDRPDVAFDGETVYYDKVMPLCWEVDHATLTVLSDWDGNRVIADYKTEPFSVIRGSTATPEGGIDTRLVPWDRMKAGEDCRGALILLPQTLFPTEWVLPSILDSGAIGLVSGTTADSGTRPDDLLWANNCSETNCWHFIKGERNFVGYSVSPNMQHRLEQACSAGEVRVHAECDGRRFEGKMPAVTAFLPGESTKEFWILAHNGEPMEDDNNNGVVMGIYTLYAIKKAVVEGKIPPLKYSVRLLLTPELYGFAACANFYGPILKERCIGAVSFDGIPARHHFLNLGFAPTAVPFYSNVLLEAVWKEYGCMVDLPPYVKGWNYSWSGDSFLSDADIGLPTIMPLHTRSSTHCWHNSYQRFDYINYPLFTRVTAVYTAHVAATVCPDPDTLAAFMPTAAQYSITRLREKAELQPLRPATDAVKRLRHAADIEIANIRDFEKADVCAEAIEAAVNQINDYVNSVTPVPAAPNPATLILERYKDIHPKRLTVGIPHDFAAVPFDRRTRNYVVALLSFVFTGMDGKKSLKDLLIEAEWDLNCRYTDAQIEDFVDTLKLLDEFHYLTLSE